MRKLMLALPMILLVFGMNAQGEREGDRQRGEKMKKLKIAYMTEELNLTQDEAQMFWPVHNKKEDDFQALRKLMKAEKVKVDNNPNMTEVDFIKTIESLSSLKSQEADIMEKYLKDSLKILGVERTNRLMDIDREFKKEMKDRMGERKHEERRRP